MTALIGAKLRHHLWTSLSQQRSFTDSSKLANIHKCIQYIYVWDADVYAFRHRHLTLLRGKDLGTVALNKPVSRRQVAQGLAWTVPAVLVAGTAPAYATSQNVVSGTVCKLHYGAGSVNHQTHSIFLGVTSSEGWIPAGTVFTWTITVSGGGADTGGTNKVPEVNYSQNNLWTLSVEPASRVASSSFTATLKFNEGYSLSVPFCEAQLIWGDISTVRPGATISVTSATKVPSGAGTGQTMGLKWTVAKRHPSSVNLPGRTPHIYLSSDNHCYPLVQWSRLITRTGYDNVVQYPDGTSNANPGWNGSNWETPARC